MKKIILLAGIIIVGALIGFFLLRGEDSVGETLGEANIKYSSDVIGTKTGTTTVGVIFGTATSSYYVKSGASDKAMFTMQALYASTTAPAAQVYLSVLGSNDWDCMTSTSTRNANDTTNEQVLMSEVNWYDIGDHVAELAGTRDLTGTSTLQWTPTPGQGKDFTLTNLNYECFRLDINASSTEMLMQVRLK